MDSMTKKRISHSETRKAAHLRLLQQLNSLPPIDTCCDICHCDCYHTHRSDEATASEPLPTRPCTKPVKRPKAAAPRTKKRSSICVAKTQPPTTTTTTTTKCKPKRTKSACSQRSNSHSRAASPLGQLSTRYMRDCEVLQDLLLRVEDNPRCELNGMSKWSSMGNLRGQRTRNERADATAADAPLKLCASMANLCLKTTVREAFERVPAHDQKILNRMACKRTEQLLAKENAWLARKYWENERYERELLKCEQTEEYKRAVRDKQYHDYVTTKARLDELAARDLHELHRLRHAVDAKDARAQQRLRALRVDRDLQLCQRRCDELRKSEAVNMQQGEHQLAETLRRANICDRLSERLHRANLLRAAALDGYLRRLRNDNYIEQLMHEEKWREAQQCELAKREQLQAHISRKRTRAQRFVETRQRRNAATTKTAKIAANLRQLVRNSVTPESLAAGGLGGAAGSTMSLGRLLLERSIPKLNLP